MVDIYMPVVQCGYVPFFADVLSIYSCILLFFLLKQKCPKIHEHEITQESAFVALTPVNCVLEKSVVWKGAL
jgi:hypothetical protein